MVSNPPPFSTASTGASPKPAAARAPARELRLLPRHEEAARYTADTCKPSALVTLMGMSFAECPEPTCAMPAEIVNRFVLASTDGPLEHVTIRCLVRHQFRMPRQGSISDT